MLLTVISGWSFIHILTPQLQGGQGFLTPVLKDHIMQF